MVKNSVFGREGHSPWRSSLLVLGFIIAEFMLIVSAQPKNAAAAPPHTSSYYMRFNETWQAYQVGCTQGTADRNGGYSRQGLMFIGFGQPYWNGSEYGTRFPGSTTFVSLNSIKWLSVEIARGYYNCSSGAGASVTIAIGTSNDAGETNFGHGWSFGTMVKDAHQQIVNEGLSRVQIAAASNMELSWNSPCQTRDWVNGYNQNAQPRLLYNVGDAQGCPPAGSCANGWTYDDIWYVSYGIPYNYPVPQIYASTGDNARQWQRISKWANTNNRSMSFKGSMTQQQACSTNYDPATCNGGNQVPATGWQQLWDTINSDGDTDQSELLFATDIRWQSRL